LIFLFTTFKKNSKIYSRFIWW